MARVRRPRCECVQPARGSGGGGPGPWALPRLAVAGTHRHCRKPGRCSPGSSPRRPPRPAPCVRLRRALSLPRTWPRPRASAPLLSAVRRPRQERPASSPGAGTPEVTSGPAGRALRLGLTFVAKRPWQHLALAGPGGCWLGATSRLDASIALTGDPTGAVTRGCSSREKGLHTALRSPPGAQRGLRGSEGRGPQCAPRSQPHACLPPRCPLW